MLKNKIFKILKITYMVFAVLIAISMLFQTPGFVASSKDILIYRISSFGLMVILFVLPGFFILTKSVRRKIPFFKKEKLLSTVLGCVLLFFIGMLLTTAIDALHSNEYDIAKNKYYAEIAVKKAQAKAEAKAKKEAEAKAKEKAKADAKAKKEAEAKAKEKAKAEAKAKKEAEAKAKEKAKAEAKAKKEAEAKAKEKAEAEAKAKAVVAKIEQKNIDVLMKATTLNQAESEQVFSNFKKVGLLSITKCNAAIGTGVDKLQSFNVEADSYTILLTIKNRKIYYIGYGGIVLFDVSKGGILNNIKNVTLTSEEITHFISAAEYYVKCTLKSPSSAKFPGQVLNLDKWSVVRNKNLVEISSYVDSQNSFGAMLRSNFTVQIEYKTSKCTYLNVDGKRLSGTYVKISN